MKSFILFVSFFDVNASIINLNSCGSTNPDGFETSFEVTAPSLDTNGFIFEVDTLRDYVRAYFSDGWYHGSCEQIAEAVAATLATHIPEATQIKVKVSNKCGHVGFHYTKEANDTNHLKFLTRATNAEVIAEKKLRNENKSSRSSC